MNKSEFWKHVDQRSPGGCWEWTAGRNSRAYGWLRWQGGEKLAHRVSWELTNGPIPDGLCVLHRCDNPPCVRPDHLFLGTRADNALDMVQKGRCSSNRLVPDDVRLVRERIASGSSHRAIAESFGVNRATISLIASGRNWGWLR